MDKNEETLAPSVLGSSRDHGNRAALPRFSVADPPLRLI